MKQISCCKWNFTISQPKLWTNSLSLWPIETISFQSLKKCMQHTHTHVEITIAEFSLSALFWLRTALPWIMQIGDDLLAQHWNNLLSSQFDLYLYIFIFDLIATENRIGLDKARPPVRWLCVCVCVCRAVAGVACNE